MSKRTTGHFEETTFGDETVRAFIPTALDSRLELDPALEPALRLAEERLARLQIAGQMVPSHGWFVYAFGRKEAVISSQIEGTQVTLADLLTFEGSGAKLSEETPDLEEVFNYLEALRYARSELAREDGLPLSMRLLNETHRRLMSGVRGKEKQPGEIRTQQNWIGGTRPGNAVFVPPPPHALADTLAAFETFIHETSPLPPLIRAGLLHAQFETIHPYQDGNGRIGRLLITLLLEHWELLSEPLLYLSLFLKRHQDEYYRLLGLVRTDGDWESWLSFFLEGVAVVADEAVETATRLFALGTNDRERVHAAPNTTVMAIRLFELLPEHPIVTIGRVGELLETTKPTAGKAVEVLVGCGVLAEQTGRARDRSFAYQAYLHALSVGDD